MESETSFHWTRHPKAEAILLETLEQCTSSNSFVMHLGEVLLSETNTRLFDWVDHFVLGHTDAIEAKLKGCGFVTTTATSSYQVFHHPGAQLPRVVVCDEEHAIGVAVTVDSIADFLMVRGIVGKIEGTPLSGFRRCLVSSEGEVSCWVVERRGTETMEPTVFEDTYPDKYLLAQEKWAKRPRSLHDEEEAISRTLTLAQELVETVGTDVAAWIVLEGERKYWQVRNAAGQLQKNRQDRIGMGWSNHDHHTFRSSRRWFPHLVRLFEMLGFHCRERFYAGEEAGWGAQVMENPRAALVLFLDVDLEPHEVEIDFAHHPIPETEKLGTIGLWCALHGDSILQSGMHHLEGQFMHEALKEGLSKQGVGTMAPFSDFPYLKQAFTKGEMWSVAPGRIDRLLDTGKITKEQADRFRTEGALGSHLENLQRREGYKGFNQKNVSGIIKRTDPRR